MAPKPYKTHQEDPTIPEGKIKFNFKMKAAGLTQRQRTFEQKPNFMILSWTQFQQRKIYGVKVQSGFSMSLLVITLLQLV